MLGLPAAGRRSALDTMRCRAERIASRVFESLLSSSLRGGQSNDEIHSLAWVVVDFDLAPMGSDNFVDNRQAQTQTGFFCGIEGVKDIVEVFWIDPLPGIFHLHLDIG